MTTAVSHTQQTPQATQTANRRHPGDDTTGANVFAMLIDTLNNFRPEGTSVPDTNRSAQLSGRRGTLLGELHQRDVAHQNSASLRNAFEQANPSDSREVQPQTTSESKQGSPIPGHERPIPSKTPDGNTQSVSRETATPSAIAESNTNKSNVTQQNTTPHVEATRQISSQGPTQTTHPANVQTVTPPPVAGTGSNATTTTPATTTEPTKSVSRTTNEAPPIQAKTKPSAIKTSAAKATPQSEPKESNIQRVARVIHAKIGRNETVARIRLDPPEMGSVNVQLRMHHDTIRIRLATETASAKDLLNNHAGELRSAIEAHGFKIDRLDFADAPNARTSDETHGQQNESPHQPTQQDDQPRQQRATDPEVHQSDFGPHEDQIDSQRHTSAEPIAHMEQVITLNRLDLKA